MAAACLCLMTACSLPFWNHNQDTCNLKDCNVNLMDLESKIDGLAKNQRIRPDQAQARKEALREEWAKYEIKAIPCKSFLEKAAFLICE